MAGLNVGIGGGRSLGPSGFSAVGGSSLGQANGATIAQTAYGAGSTESGGLEHWHTFMGVQVAALVWLVFLRWSLPSGSKKGA